ncbi:MAG TPA: PKD domain-containing protein [Solirubrobacterales bacterium]|nr:PKD domain-containing protein [Solirubrobacterales bacterium]
MNRRVAVLIVLVVGMLSTTVGSASAAGWLEPTDISASNEVLDGRPEVAVDPAGNAVAIWERHVGGEEIVEATERPAGGDWSVPEVLSLPGEEGKQSRVGIDASGNAIAVWITEEAPSTFVVRSAARPPGGEWSEPEDVSDSISEAVTPWLALDAASGAVAVWTAFEGGDRILQGAVRSADGEWSEPDDLSEAGEDVTPLEAPDVAIDASGNAIAVWKLESSNFIVQAAVRPAGGDWEAPDDLSAAGEDAGEPSVAVDEAGEAVAVWNRLDGVDTIQTAVRPAGGDWAGPDDLSDGDQEAREPDVTMDEAGQAVAVWTRYDGSNFIVQAAVRPAGDEWSDPDFLSVPGQTSNAPVVATNAAVGAVAMWFRFDGANFRVQATVRPPGGEWPKPDTLSAAGEGAAFPQLALDAAGDAIAVFGRNGDDGLFAQATGYDFAAPQLDAVQIPATGTVGERVSFGVSPFDVFPFTTSWTFGDGGSGAKGSAVSHVYARPGAYPVTVSSVDAGGNTSTRLGAIAIAAIDPPTPRPKIKLDLRIEGESLGKLMRTGTLRLTAGVNETASVNLSGRAKLKVRRAGGGARNKLVPVFVPKTVRFAAEGEEKVTLALSKQGRKKLRSLSQVRLLIAGEARDDAGDTAKKKVARTLR